MRNVNADNINIFRYIRHLLLKRTLKQILISVIIFSTSRCLLEHYVLNQYFPQLISDQFSGLKVQKHFQWNSVQVKYDAFHMVMYELWMRRHTIRRLPYQFEALNSTSSAEACSDQEFSKKPLSVLSYHLSSISLRKNRKKTSKKTNMESPNPTKNSVNEFWTIRRGLTCFFVIVLSICFSIYHPAFPLSFQAPRQASAQDSDIFARLFHTPEDFNVDYMEMEKNFKIFVYPHNTTICDEPRKPDGEYASEGLFFENLYQSRILTKDPDKAHLFLIPTSCHSLPAEGRSVNERSMAMVDFVMSLISNYPYWNRTLGADHFFVTCSDIHVTATARIVNLMKNSIRVMCSPRYDVEYAPHKDVSLPQSVQPFDVSAAGSDTRERYLKNLSLQAINYGCVPVILSDYYDVPFKDILDWKKFSVIIKEIDVYQLKKILAEIPKMEYEALHTNAIMVQKHFEWNLPSVRLDAFHMVMYELWMRRRVTKY